MSHIQVSMILVGEPNEIYDYLCLPENLPKLLKGDIDVEVIASPEWPIKKSNEISFMMSRFGVSQTVRISVIEAVRGDKFSYRQVEGIYKSWSHTIKFEKHGQNETLVTDLIDYRLPFGILGFLTDDLFARGDMIQILQRRLEKARKHFQELVATKDSVILDIENASAQT